MKNLKQQKSKEQRFDDIYTSTFDKLYNIFQKSLKNEDLTLDILQETYLKLWHKLDDLDPDRGYMAFLFFHARNFARREIAAGLRRDNLQHEIKLLSDAYDMETDLEKLEYSKLLTGLVNNLPPKRRLVYRMFKEEGLSYKTIAQRLNISSKTVDNHLNEAVKKIRKQVLFVYGVHNYTNLIVLMWAFTILSLY